MSIKKFFLALGTCSLLFSACTQTTSSDNSSYDDLFPENEYFEDEFETELYYNYLMLDILYIYGHTRNEINADYRVYLGKGNASVNDVKGYCTEDYFDVCYMYNQMADPFTQYFDPYVAPQVLKSILATEELVGIGAEVKEVPVEGSNSNILVITQVYPDAPSDKAGLKEGDVIYQIEGLPISTTQNFDKMTTGNIGDSLQVSVFRGADTLSDTVTVNIVLAQYHTPSVFTHYEDSIPVIEITQFVDTFANNISTYEEFVAALKKTEGATSTIIDLRRNPGGSTDQCNNAASELLSQGDTIVIDIQVAPETVTENGTEKYIQAFDTITYTATSDGIGKNRYYVLLASDTSASCAETFLSAVAANKKSPFVGKLTYGKGIGQSVNDSTYAGGLSLITALQGFDKNWESYHDLGIVPDYDIDDPDEQMAKAVELAKEAKAVRTAGYGTERLHHFSKTQARKNQGKIPTLRDLKMRYFIKK